MELKRSFRGALQKAKMIMHHYNLIYIYLYIYNTVNIAYI